MPSKPFSKIDIEQEFLLRIGSENSSHSISWDILKSVGDKLEALVLTIAKYSLEDGASVLDNFKLEFSGFYDGSPVPAFKLNSTPVPTLFNDKAARQSVKDKFSIIINDAAKGDYQSIIDGYNTPGAKNEIIKKVYDFSNSAGNLKVAFVKRNKDQKFDDIYTLRKLQKETLDNLLIADSLIVREQSIGETLGVARVITKKSPTGRISTKAQQIYNDKEAILSLKLSEISFGTNKYIFKTPILFQIYTEGKGTIIENESLDIYAGGKNISQAKDELYFQFDNIYQRLNNLNDDQIGSKLLEVKQYYNFVIKSLITL